VAVRDTYGNLVFTDSSSSVTLTISTGTFAGGQTSVTALVIGGVATFSAPSTGLIINKSGSYTFKASDGALTTATSGTIAIGAAPASQLLLQQVPTAGTAGVALTPATKVAVFDSFGNPVTSALSVTLTLSNGNFSSGATTTTATSSGGIATFSSLNISTAGAFTLQPSLGAIVGAPFTVTINAAAPSKLAFQTAPPTTGIAGIPLTQAVVPATGSANPAVVVLDKFGNLVTGDQSPVTLTLSKGTFANGASSITVTAIGGIATFGGLNSPIINIVGSYTLKASDGALTTVTSGSIAITPAAPWQTVFQTIPITATAGVAFGAKVAVEDAFGNIVTNDSSIVTLGIATGPSGFTVSSVSSVAAVNGVATFTQLALTASASYTLNATDGLLAVAVSGNIAISPAAAAKLAIQPAAAAGIAGVAINPIVQVGIQDQFGNVVTNNSSTVTLTLSSGTYSTGKNTATAVASAGIASFSGLTINAPGSYTWTASDGTLTKASSGIVITNPASKLILQQAPNTGTAGVTLTPAVKVIVEDQSGAIVVADASTITLTLNGGTFANGNQTVTAQVIAGVATLPGLTINTAGRYTFTASDGTLTSATSGILTIAPATASQLVFQVVPQVGTAGAALIPAVTVAVEDAFGNIVTRDTSTVSISIAAGPAGFADGSTVSAAAINGIATFGNLVLDTAGAYTFQAADGTLIGPTSCQITIAPAAASQLVFQIVPQEGTTGAALNPVVIVAVEDAFGNIVTGDTSIVTINIAAGPAGFADGSTLSAVAINGIATFDNLVLETAGTYTLQAADGTLIATYVYSV
jgi:hypothetical protein